MRVQFFRAFEKIPKESFKIDGVEFQYGKHDFDFSLFYIAYRKLGRYKQGYPQLTIIIFNIEIIFTFNNKNLNNLFKGD